MGGNSALGSFHARSEKRAATASFCYMIAPRARSRDPGWCAESVGVERASVVMVRRSARWPAHPPHTPPRDRRGPDGRGHWGGSALLKTAPGPVRSKKKAPAHRYAGVVVRRIGATRQHLYPADHLKMR